MKYLVTLTILFSSLAFADQATQNKDYERHKEHSVKFTNQEISILTKFRDCMQSTTNWEGAKACGRAQQDEQARLRADKQADEQAMKAEVTSERKQQIDQRIQKLEQEKQKLEQSNHK